MRVPPASASWRVDALPVQERLGWQADVRGHRLGLLARALLLAVAGAAVVAIATFVVGSRYYSYGPNPPNWPPYLGLPLLAVTLGLGIVVWAVARLWAGAEGSAAPRDGASRA